jgi:phage-related protein
MTYLTSERGENDVYLSTYFEFRGKNSKDFNLQIVTLEDTFEETFGFKKEIQSEQNGNGKIITHKMNIKAGEIRELRLAFADENDITTKATFDERNPIVKWLQTTSTFFPIYFDEQPNHCYYINVVEALRWDNFSEKGYLTLKIVFLYDFMFTRPYWKILNAVSGTTNFTVFNESNLDIVPLSPYMTISPRSTTITINNLSTNQSVTFSNLDPTKKLLLEIDNDLQQYNGFYQDIGYNTFNYEFLKLKRGMNQLQIVGNCIINMKLSFPIAV